MPRLEVLYNDSPRPDVERLLGSICASSRYVGLEAIASTAYRGDCEWLAVYGVGSPMIREAVDAHKAQGGNVLQFDLGYWDRYTLQRRWRISINADHPTAEDVARTPPDPNRLSAARARFTRRPARDGAIERVLVVGIGPKSRAALNLDGPEWELAAMARAHALAPGAEVWYKPKHYHLPLDGEPALRENVARVLKEPDIDKVLREVDLVLCRHSNVAVDCAINGTRCLVEGGIGAYLYGNTLPCKAPTQERRMDFLMRVGQWQWSRAEMYDCLKFVLAHHKGAKR